MRNFLNKYFSKLIIGLLVIVCTWYGKNLDTWGRNSIIDNDVVSYYAYLPATLIFHDLNFSFIKDLPPDFEGKIWVSTAPNGKPVLRMTMGLAILWLPFFLFAHLQAHVLGGFNTWIFVALQSFNLYRGSLLFVCRVGFSPENPVEIFQGLDSRDNSGFDRIGHKPDVLRHLGAWYVTRIQFFVDNDVLALHA